MTYKETLFFIGKCLTITHEEHNRLEVEQELKNGQVNWDAVVKVSTAQYVFPALYCNLKRANFLHYLPEELVNYMVHITDLNRERNQQIIEQAYEINTLLLANNVTPIFLKGTAFLLQDFYEDIAERMVGDIDFLVSDEEFKKTVEILKIDGYLTPKEGIDRTFLNRHYDKIIKKNKTASVEVHYKMVHNPYHKKFNYTTIKKTIKKNKNKICTLSDENQFLMTCFNKQMNDRGQLNKTISLRNSYDLYIHSLKIDTLKTIKKFNYYFKEFNAFLGSTAFVFNNPKTILFENNLDVEKFLTIQINYINFPNKEIKNRKKWDIYFLYKSRLTIVIKSFYDKNNRQFIITKLKNLFKPIH